jgi:hypothetical protein
VREKLDKLFVNNWQRKLVALFFAVFIWFLVDHTIAVTNTFVNVAIRVINIPDNKTIEGLRADGTLKRDMTLTLKGSKEVLKDLRSEDIEVVINAQGKGDEWIVHVTKKDLVCVDPELDLVRNINEVNHSELFIRLEKLITEKIPIKVKMPAGEPPEGYQFLDIWPETLTITISGPASKVRELKSQGIDWRFDLSDIKKSELDHLGSLRPGTKTDEIVYYVPEQWKTVYIPFLGDHQQMIDDPASNYLQIDFLRNALIPIEQTVPVAVFFPLDNGLNVNPQKFNVAINGLIQEENGIKYLNLPLYARNVSRLFLDVVLNNLEIVVVAQENPETQRLPWSIQFVNANALEDKYIEELVKSTADKPKMSDQYLRERFRNYLHRFHVYGKDGNRVDLDIKFKDGFVVVENNTKKASN